MCPGLNVAERSLFLGIARMLWAFNITKAKDANGNEIPIDRDAIEVSQSACPKPFKYVPTHLQQSTIVARDDDLSVR